MTQTESRAAIVTGGSRGIGRAIAERPAGDGFAVAVNYAGNRAKAEETVAAIKAAGGKSVAIAGDVSEEADVARIYEGTKEAFGRVDDSLKDPLPDTLTWNGITVYGTVDVGYAYQTNGRPLGSVVSDLEYSPFTTPGTTPVNRFQLCRLMPWSNPKSA